MTTTDVQIDETITVAPALSWRSILAGVVIAVVVQVLLSILGGAIGLTLVNPTESGNPSGTAAAIVATIWWTLSGILAAWAGGLTAGRLSGAPGTVTAAWHGLIAWAVTVLLVFWLLAAAVGGVVGGAFSLLGGIAGTATQAASAAAPAVAQAADPFGDIEASLNDALGVKDPAAGRAAVASFVRSAFAADQADAQASMDRAADALARATGVTPEDAKKTLADWKAEYDKTVAAAKQKAADAANAARKAAASAGILGFVALVFGALAGWFGGRNSGGTGYGLGGAYVERRISTTP
ncbi:MAG: PhnA-like protein [Rhizobiales bacterium]|nr:PhnA-like protein [Hyphomicrobiales bacterium]